MAVTSNSFAKVIKVSSDKSNINLYPHQMDAITNLNKKINSQENFSGILVLPTGGGKTLTAVRWILKNIIDKGQKVLWIAHRHELLNQALDTVLNNAYSDVLGDTKSIQYRIISGIHDKPVNIKPEDDLLIASKDSINYGMNYLLVQWVKQNRNNIFLVIDEAHHSAAKTYRKTIEVLKKENTKSFKMLGLTATPFRTSEAENKILKEIFEDDIVYGIDLKTLIARKILADPIFEELSTKLDVSKDLTEKDIKAIQAFDSIPEGVASNIATSKERNNFIVTHYSENREKYGQLLVFALNIEHAIALKGLFEKRNIPSEYVVSSLKDSLGNTVSNKENEEKIQRFREEKINVLININILTEGIDLPNAQTVFLTRPTISTILMTQMIGRVLRGEKANGTEKAYIVSFIDDWKDKIAWVNPEKLLVLEGTTSPDKEYEKREQIMRLISIHKMEEFAKIMDDMVDTDEIERIPFIQRVPIGLYSFSILISADEEEWSKNCDVIVYDALQESYERFISDLEEIFKEKGLENKEKFDDYELEYLCKFIKNDYFQEYNQVIHSKDQDIKDIILYFAQTGVKPEFLAFEDRKSYDLAQVARYIWDQDMGIRKQGSYLDTLWEDEKSFWRVFFGQNKKYFLNQIDKELQKIKNPELFSEEVEGVEVIEETINENQLTLHQLKEVNYNTWEKLVEQVYERAKDEQGYYHSAISDFKSKQRRDFQIDHIRPMSKGGLTVLENLQLLTVLENRQKGNKWQGEAVEFNAEKNPKGSIELAKEDILKEISREREQGNFIKAIEASDKGIEKFPEEWNFYNEKGNLLLGNNKAQEALECYNEALKLKKNSGDLYFNKGKALDILNNVEEALEYYKKATEINPKDVEALYYVGDILLCKEKPKEAIDYFEKAIKENPKYSYGYVGKGEVKLFNRRYKDALDNFEKAIELDENNYIAYLSKGSVENIKKHYQEALESLTKAEALCKNDDRIFNEKGHSLLGLKKYEEAIREYEKALELFPESIDAYLNIAFIKGDQRKYSEAITYYKKVIELDPNHLTAYNNLGHTCYKVKKFDDALKYYDEALKIDPSYSYALKNKKDLLNKLKK